MKESFASKDKNWYQCGIKELAERWLQMVHHNGFYFECCFCYNLKDKIAKYYKTFDSS